MGAGARTGAGAETRAGAGTRAGVRTEAKAGTRARAGTGARAGIGARAETGPRASRTALKILCKSSSEYLGTIVSTGALATRGFAPKGSAGWLDNSSPDLGVRKESGGATDGAAEECLRRGRKRPQTEVIFELIFSKTLFQTGWMTP